MDSIVSQKVSRGQGHELLNRLEAAGLTPDLAQEIVDAKDNYLARAIIRAVGEARPHFCESYERARRIMGRNFFGINEAGAYFGIEPSRVLGPALFARLANGIPFADEMLKACRETHILVAVFPISIMEIREQPENRHLFDRQDWYADYPFAKERGELGWHLVRKAPVDNSRGKPWDEQISFLHANESVPTARVMTYSIIGHFRATGELLLDGVGVRTADTTCNYYREHVASFGTGSRLVIDHFGDGKEGYPNIGLASSIRH